MGDVILTMRGINKTFCGVKAFQMWILLFNQVKYMLLWKTEPVNLLSKV